MWTWTLCFRKSTRVSWMMRRLPNIEVKAMRVTKIPVLDQGDEIPAKVHRAERLFLESLRAEASASRRPVQSGGRGRTVKVTRSSAGAARGRGKSLGEGFARLNGGALRQAESFATAIE